MIFVNDYNNLEKYIFKSPYLELYQKSVKVFFEGNIISGVLLEDTDEYFIMVTPTWKEGNIISVKTIIRAESIDAVLYRF